MELQVGVKALLKNKEGKYLLCRRSHLKYPDAGGAKWDIVGGRIDPGSTLLDNLKREIKEEIGLDLVKPVRLVGAQDILRVPGRHVVRLTYIGEIEGTPQISEEHLDHGWFTLEEMKGFTEKEIDIYVKDLLDRGAFEISA